MSGRPRRRCCASSTSTAEELRLIDAELGQVALGREEVRRLMTHPRRGRHGRAVDRGRGR